ncbi:MAG: alkaline phosphatase family protein [bacterium]
MRTRLIIALATFVVVTAAVTGITRWSYFSQEPHPTLRLSQERFGRLTERLVILLVDSVPFNMAFRADKMPFVSGLRRRATWGRARTEEPSMTGQMIYTIVTGARPYLYGVVRNWRQNRMPHETFFDGFFRAGLRIHVYGDEPWNEMFGDRFHRVFTLAEDGRTRAGRPLDWEHAVNELDLRVLPVVDRALAAERFDVLVWHLHGTDLVMHKYLRDSRLTADKLHWADLLVEGVVSQLDDGRTTFLVLSDHGCAVNGRHGYLDREAKDTFYALFGPRIRAGIRLDLQQVDFSPTVSALFGRTPGAVSAGRPAVEAFAQSAAARAARVVAAAEQRVRYLQARERRQPTGVALDRALVKRARKELDAGRVAEANVLATRFLRAAWRADLDARRERRLLQPVMCWFGLVIVLLGWAVLLQRQQPRAFGSSGRSRHLVIAGAVVVVTWSLALLGSVYAGRFFNSYFDVWSPAAQAAAWILVLGALLAGGVLLRRPVARAARAQPLIWAWAGIVLAAVLPGYFQGLYAPVFACCGLALLLLFGDRDAGRPWLAALLAGAILAAAIVWEYHWRPHFYYVRDYSGGTLGAVAAGLAYGVAVLAVGRPRRVTPLLWAGLVLAALLAARHGFWPGPTRFDVATSGDHLLAQLDVRVLSAGVAALAWLGLRRFGLGGADGAALGALAVLCAWGSAFEATAFALFTAALAPLGRSRWLQGSGLGSAIAAAALLVVGRVIFSQPHEFYFNFTAVHDLLRFAPDMDRTLPALAVPVLVRYTLPALVLLPLLWGRLEPPQQLTALCVVLLFVGARALHLLMVTRLTIDQLYANWRGVGELIITTLWALGLALAFALWWSARWADGIALAGRGRAAVASD